MREKVIVVRCGGASNAAGLIVKEGTPLYERLIADRDEKAVETNVPVRLSEVEKSFKDKMIEKRASIIYETYTKHFDQLEVFEANLFDNFEKSINEKPLEENHSQRLKISIPYYHEIELQMLKAYLETLTSRLKSIYDNEGIKVNAYQNNEKKNGVDNLIVDFVFTLSLEMQLPNLFK